MEAKIAQGAPAWIELAKKAQLPILKASAKLLTKQIKADASLADMALTVERDPALCLHLFLAANHLNQNEDVEILSLSHVITILGMQGVVNVVKKAPQLDLHESDAYQKAYLQAQSNSSFAGVLVENWAEHISTGSPEKMKWATILAGAPIWIMWRIAYGQMRKCEWQIGVQRIKQEKAQLANFACLLDDLYRMIGRQLKLPNMSQQVLERAERPSIKQWGKMLSPRYLDFLDDDNKLKHAKTKPATLMSLMMNLASQINNGWMSRKSLRAQIILSHLSGKPLPHTINKNNGLAVKYSRQLLFPQVFMPAASLIWPLRSINDKPLLRPAYNCWNKVPEEVQAKVQAIAMQTQKAPVDKTPANKAARGTGEGIADHIPKKKHPPRKINENVLNGIIDKFNKQVATFKDIHEIMLTCNKALHEGLGMRHAFIGVLNKGTDSLRPVYSVGLEKDNPIRGMNIRLSENRFIGKLIIKPASFKVDRDNYTQVKGMLCEDVVKMLKNENFMVMSLFAKGKPIGVVYTDASATEDRISDEEYAAFKQICQSTSHALDAYAKRSKAKS